VAPDLCVNACGNAFIEPPVLCRRRSGWHRNGDEDQEDGSAAAPMRTAVNPCSTYCKKVLP